LGEEARNRKHNQFQLLYGNCNKKSGVSSVLFELLSIITIYFGGSSCGKNISRLRRWVDRH